MSSSYIFVIFCKKIILFALSTAGQAVTDLFIDWLGGLKLNKLSKLSKDLWYSACRLAEGKSKATRSFSGLILLLFQLVRGNTNLDGLQAGPVALKFRYLFHTVHHR